MRILAAVLLLATACFGEAAESAFVVYPADCNHLGSLFGGKIMSEMDRVAGIATRRFLYASETRDAVTIAINKVRFLKAGAVKDLVIVSGEVVAAGEKSITIAVKVERETDRGRELLADAEFVFVAFDLREKKAAAHGLKVGAK